MKHIGSLWRPNMIFVGLHKVFAKRLCNCGLKKTKISFQFYLGGENPHLHLSVMVRWWQDSVGDLSLNYSCCSTVQAEYHIEMWASYTKSISTLALILNMYFSVDCQSMLSVITVPCAKKHNLSSFESTPLSLKCFLSPCLSLWNGVCHR